MLVNAIWSPIRIKCRTFDWGGEASYHSLDCRRGDMIRRKRLFLCRFNCTKKLVSRFRISGIDRHTLRDMSQVDNG
jgi:hypothetical protein